MKHQPDNRYAVLSYGDVFRIVDYHQGREPLSGIYLTRAKAQELADELERTDAVTRELARLFAVGHPGLYGDDEEFIETAPTAMGGGCNAWYIPFADRDAYLAITRDEDWIIGFYADDEGGMTDDASLTVTVNAWGGPHDDARRLATAVEQILYVTGAIPARFQNDAEGRALAEADHA